MCLHKSHSHFLHSSFHFSASRAPTHLSNPLRYQLPLKSLAPVRELEISTYGSLSVCSYFCYRICFVYFLTYLSLSVLLLALTSFRQRACFISSFYLQFPVPCLPHVKDIIREWNLFIWVGCSDGRRRHVVEAPGSRIIPRSFKLQFCYFWLWELVQVFCIWTLIFSSVKWVE